MSNYKFKDEDWYEAAEKEMQGEGWAGKLIALETIKIPPGDMHYAHEGHLIITSSDELARKLIKERKAVPYTRARHQEVLQARNEKIKESKDDLGVSTDYDADEAISKIKVLPQDLLKDFLAEDDDRVTVKRAYAKRTGEDVTE